MNKLLEPTEEMIEAGQIAGNLQYAKVIRSYEAMISKSETIPKLLAALEAADIYIHCAPEPYTDHDWQKWKDAHNAFKALPAGCLRSNK